MPGQTCHTPLSFFQTPERLVYSLFSWGPNSLCPRELFILQVHWVPQKIIYYSPKSRIHHHSPMDKKRAQLLSHVGVADNYTMWLPPSAYQIIYLSPIRLSLSICSSESAEGEAEIFLSPLYYPFLNPCVYLYLFLYIFNYPSMIGWIVCSPWPNPYVKVLTPYN